MVGENRAMRPFWLHQVAEYVIGAVFISTGFQSPTPLVPALLGGAVIVNAAFSDGPGGAFRVMHRKVHRVIDLVIIAAVLVAAVQPFVSIETNGRILIGLLGVVLAFVWWNTDFATKDERKARRRATARPSAEEVGRAAGRSAARGVEAARRWKGQFDGGRSGAVTDGTDAAGERSDGVADGADGGPGDARDPGAGPG